MVDDARSVRKWLKFSAPPERRAAEPTPCSPNYFLTYLSGRWAEGCVRGRQLFQEIKLRGYTGSFSHLERLLAMWRGDPSAKAAKNNNDHTVLTSPPNSQPRTKSRKWRFPAPSIPDRLANLADRCRGALHQAARITDARSGREDRRVKKRLAGVHDHARSRNAVSRDFQGKDTDKLDVWLDDAQRSGIYAMQRFARTLRRDIDAVKNAVTECWSNGQTEGQINRLKTLKRAMYGRAGSDFYALVCCRFICPFSTECEARPPTTESGAAG